MKLGKLLFRSRWQDKDAAVRRQAVATDDDPELIAALPALAREDPDAAVRLAALERANDYALWRERASADADAAVRARARAACLDRLCADAAAPPAMAERLAELATLSAPELEQVATNAKPHELREAALQRVTRGSVLAACVLHDPDPALRLRALERIDDIDQLTRLAERTRKTDKLASRRARERADALRVARGDSVAIVERARRLCERIEALLRAPAAEAEAELDGIERAFAELGDGVPAELRNRHAGARDVLLRARENRSRIAAAATDAAPAAEELGPTVTGPEALVPRARFDAALAAAAEERRREREARHARQRELEALLPEYQAALDAGDSARAQDLKQRIDALVAAIGILPGALERRLAPLNERQAELARWLMWSQRQRRRALCADIEALLGSGLHPDAIANRVHEARAEWQRLDAREGRAAAQPPTGLDRRFHAACQRALRTTRPYFEKRDALRHARTEAVHALLDRAAALPEDSTDWQELAQLRTALGAALHTLDGVDPHERSALARRIKQYIAAIEPRLATRAADVEVAKRRLIERARALADAQPRELPRRVRELQQEWTALGGGRRSVDQRQWREFRAACDAAFGRLDAARKERESQTAAVRAQALEVIEQLEALAQSGPDAGEDGRRSLRELEARWEALAVDDRALARRFRDAREAIALALKDAARRTRLARYTTALQRYRVLQAWESGALSREDALAQWAALPPIAADFAVPLEAHHARLRDGAARSPADTHDEALDILVRLEFLGGVESPPADRQRRMDIQVQRLSSRLRGGAADDPAAELAALLTRWFALPAAPAAELERRFARAAQAAIETLP